MRNLGWAIKQFAQAIYSNYGKKQKIPYKLGDKIRFKMWPKDNIHFVIINKIDEVNEIVELTYDHGDVFEYRMPFKALLYSFEPYLADVGELEDGSEV